MKVGAGICVCESGLGRGIRLDREPTLGPILHEYIGAGVRSHSVTWLWRFRSCEATEVEPQRGSNGTKWFIYVVYICLCVKILSNRKFGMRFQGLLL